MRNILFGFCFIGFLLSCVGCRVSSQVQQDNRDFSEYVLSNENTSDLILKKEGIPGLPKVFPLVVGFNNEETEVILFQPDSENPAFENNPTIVKNFPKFDILNCAGYLGSGYSFYENGAWNIQFLRRDAVPDIVEKINKCSGKPPKSNDISSYGFAIAPANETRKDIEFKDKPNVAQVFAALSIDEKKRAADEDGKSLFENPQLVEQAIGKWYADSNGDGLIDLISVSGNCVPYFSDSGSCDKIWQLTSGNWTEVSSRGFDEAKEIYTYSKEPELLSGTVTVINGALSLGEDKRDGIWSNGDSRYGIEPKPTKIGTIKEAAIFNCAGYLATAKAEKIHDEPFQGQDDLYSWKLKIISDSVAPNAAAKVKKCAEITEENDFNRAFALFNFSPEIKNVRVDLNKIKKPDLKKLYQTLPNDLKQWLKISEDAKEISPRTKNTISLETDNWADINGDGIIDLIEVYGVCSGTVNGAYSCTRIFQLFGDQWREISFNTPL